MSWILDIFWWLIDFVIRVVKERPTEAFLFALVVIRSFGTTVQTGWKGVLFRFGRVRRELDPGFHWLIPFFEKVRKTPTRSITLHLPMQHITTADGLVYEVQANLIYRVAEPMTALVQISDVRQGCEAMVPVIVQDLLRSQTRAQLQDRSALDKELAARAEASLQRWGLVVEQAGFMNIAPTKKTLRLTQLALLIRERQRVLQHYMDTGLAPDLAAALLGADRRVCGRASARYRARGAQVTALRKALQKLFKGDIRQRLIEEAVKAGHDRAEATKQVETRESEVREEAEARARTASLQTAMRRRALGEKLLHEEERQRLIEELVQAGHERADAMAKVAAAESALQEQRAQTNARTGSLRTALGRKKKEM